MGAGARASALVSLAAFYGMYALVAGRAARAEITLGDLTLYIAVFRQGQGAVQAVLRRSAAMYEDALFMSNLFALPRHPDRRRGAAGRRRRARRRAAAPA